jgi:hypothetical protein
MGSTSRQGTSKRAHTDATQASTKRRAMGWLALLLCLIGTALAGLAVIFAIRNHRSPRELMELAAAVTLILGFSLVGAVIAVRRPRHRLGWIFCTIGLSQALVTFANEYAVFALWTAPGSLPGGAFAAWLTTWVWAGGFPVLLTFLPLLFPTGRLPSPRWRPAAWLSTVPIGLLCGPIALLNWPLRGPSLVGPENWSEPSAPGALAVLYPMVGIFMWLAGLACVLALVVRFRRSRHVERQQLKWFMFAAALTFVVFWVTDQLGARGVQLGIVSVLQVVVAPVIPIAAGIAIVRYRLYDIDRLINRTLVYGLLTGLLGAVYVGSVLSLGQLFGGIGATPPTWAVAGATLAVAALFQPARRRIQRTVDRRFNRRHHDAAKTIDAFNARLRDEIDLDTLSTELVGVVDQTMEPTAVSLWLRGPMEQSGRPLG